MDYVDKYFVSIVDKLKFLLKINQKTFMIHSIIIERMVGMCIE